MCGIAGVIDKSGHNRADVTAVVGMCDAMRHRGPDGDGFYSARNVALGMRRLSIIDVEGSDQPLYNEDRSIAMVFNGEIYNYREIRADLLQRGHRFHTEGDGETLVHLYEEHGLDLFDHLRGMFAFALWDSHAERLVLAIDHIGMKPLYLHERDGLLHFASEVKALPVNHSLNLDVLDTYLSFGYMIGNETLFEGVRRLPPGHALVVEHGESRLHRFWAFGENVRETHPYADNDVDRVINDARDLLQESVKLHLRSDVPLGLFLSGGVDSAAMLALTTRQVDLPVQTFTVGFDMATPDNELLQARRVAAHFNADHHERVINADDWWDGLLRYVYHHDEPNANPSAVSLLLLAEHTAQHVKVVLTGLGGDELFAGYGSHRTIPNLLHATATWGKLLRPVGGLLGALEPHYPAFKRYRVIGALPTYLPRLRHATLPRDEALRRSYSFDGLVFTDALREQLYAGDLRGAWRDAQHKERTYAAIIERSLRDDPYDTAQALLINTWLTGNALLNADKVTMAHSLEARVPFFDPVLLDFAARVPPAVRMVRNKFVLREAMRPYLPDFALQRPKQPFGTPIRGWFERDLREKIQSVLLDDGAFDGFGAVFNRAALESLLDGHFSGREKHEEVVFRLLLLELWRRRFLVEERAVSAP